jgi:nucleoside-diphosphate-sugar epimerase
MPPAPLSPYASSRLSGGQVFCRTFGSEAVIPRFLDALASGNRPVNFGDGGQSCDCIYIDNVVDANLRAAAAPGDGGQEFNVASG